MMEKEIRCKHCSAHKLLAKIRENGKILVWCKECKKEVELEVDFSFPNSKSITIPKIKMEVEPYEPKRNPVQSEKN